MHERIPRAALALATFALVCGGLPLAAQHVADSDSLAAHSMEGSDAPMWSTELGAGWRAMGMAQILPVATFGAPFLEASPLNATGWYLTQPAAMVNLAGPGDRVVLRTTLNFEGLTQGGGELTYGGWGEGFIDKRHPHTLLHELVLSLNLFDQLGGDLSLSAGKGFAPFGTDDPMSRPGLKYPTNHHLSQVLERWFVGGTWLREGWGVEASVFGGSEPEGPYDFGNIESFPDSWSLRLSKRWPAAAMGSGWEVSASHAQVVETHEIEAHGIAPHGAETHQEDGPVAEPGAHGGEEVATGLWNAAIRYSGDSLLRYALLEASTARGPGDDDFFSALAEGRLRSGAHEPYLRVEYATRPEYAREGTAAPGFFRYDHDTQPIGATRWLIGTVGYGVRVTDLPFSVRPFVELQGFSVRQRRGSFDPGSQFGGETFWGLTLGARVFLGGDPMRMGAYGMLDAMTRMGGMEPGMEGMGGM